MSRGGGRGFRGGFSNQGASRGPTLPWSLQQQVGAPNTGAGPSRGGGGAGRGGRGGFGRGGGRGGNSSGTPVFSHRPAKRKEQRKAARQERKHQRYEHQQHAQHRHAGQQQQQQQHAGAKRRAADTQGAQNPAKRQKSAPQQQQQQPQQLQQPTKQLQKQSKLKDSSKPPAAAAGAAKGGKARSSSGGDSKKTMFYDLLAEQGVVAPSKAAAAGGGLQAAFLQDLRTELELARKLKVKKGSKRSGPEDGLDDFLSGITQLLPDSIKRSKAAAAAAAAASPGSDEGSEGEDEQSIDADGSDSEGDPFGLGEDSEGSEDLGDESDEMGMDESSDGEGLGFGADDVLGDEDDVISDGDDVMEQEEESSDDGSLRGDESDELDGGSGFDSGSSSDLGEGEGGAGVSESEGDGSGSSGSDDDADEQQLQQQQRRQASKRQRQEAAAGVDNGDEQPQQQQLPAAAAVASAAKYIPPALRRAQEAAAAAAAAGGQAGIKSSSLPVAVQRRITGLLNRLAEANLQGIVRDIIGVYETEGRRAVAEAVSAGLLAAVAEGPRATEQFAAIVAVFVAGIAATARAQDISARFLEQLVKRLEQAYTASDGLACHNLIMTLAYCYSTGLVAADCMYSVLGELTRRFTEADVAMMLTLLNAVGLQLRSADPAAMKDFVLAVHNRAATAGAAGGMSKRAEIMLELVMDIKNNRLREGKASKAAAAAAAAAGKKGRGGAAAVVQPGLLKWLRQSGVDDVTLSNISWAKLVQPDKKGMWWHPAATDAAAGLLPGVLADTLGSSGASAAAAAAAAAAADAEEGVMPGAGGADAQAGGAVGAGQLLQLAAGLRMTTDVRRAVFVAIMGSEDCAEACEKLLRLPLKGDQSREVVRVLVECCLQEARYNPYYGHLAARLAAVSKGYKVTLQYCLWDQWKTVTSTEPRRLLCLAGLVGQLLASCVLPLSSLKPIDFDAAGSWTSKETFLWRHTLQLLLNGFSSDAECEAAFARLASQQPLGALAKGLGSFLKLRVGPWVVAQGDAGALKGQAVDVCLGRLARAEKLLLSSAAAVLAA